MVGKNFDWATPVGSAEILKNMRKTESAFLYGNYCNPNPAAYIRSVKIFGKKTFQKLLGKFGNGWENVLLIKNKRQQSSTLKHFC